ncbi:Abi family protein [Phocaeicola dorei]|nr:Abi family protein [Phocaeicola dorei]
MPSCRKTEVGTLGTPNGRSIISEILAIRGLAAICVPCCRPKEVHRYKADSSFQDALNSYRFDKKLRLFLFNDIEKVEIALRSALTNIVTRKLAISPG